MSRSRSVSLAAPAVLAVFAVVSPIARQAPAPAPYPASFPPVGQADYVIKNFKFRSGETLPELKMHYRTVGKLQKNAQGVATNAVLVMHGTGGAGSQFIQLNFGGELFGPGQLLDGTKYFIVMPDDLGHGGSSKPSDGLHAKFPKYGYLDMVEAEYRLLAEGLGVSHLRLVMGTSMGGMHTWLWGEEHPKMMDALMPLASLPIGMSGRNRAWRRIVIDAIANDPAWNHGEYTTQPPSLRTAAEVLYVMSDNPVRRQAANPTLAQADQSLDQYVAAYLPTHDATDVLYQFRSSEDYDPNPKLEQIAAPLIAINTADDLINPPELGALEREVKRVPHGQAFVLPRSDKTVGHSTHTVAVVWKSYLEQLLAATAK